MRAAGHTPTDEQVAEWRKAVAPMEEEWKKAVNDAGGDADAIKADLDETLKKYNSKY